jgi:hypothetical protein
VLAVVKLRFVSEYRGQQTAAAVGRGHAEESADASAARELPVILRDRAVALGNQPRKLKLKHTTLEDFVMVYGHAFESHPLDEEERGLVADLVRAHHEVWTRFEYNLCFTTAQQLLAHDLTGTLVYVEGFVWGHADGLPPVHHGWLSLKSKVIDLTAPTRATASELPPEPPQLWGEFTGRAYFGVPFLRSYVRARCDANGCWGSLLEDEDDVSDYPRCGGAVRELCVGSLQLERRGLARARSNPRSTDHLGAMFTAVRCSCRWNASSSSADSWRRAEAPSTSRGASSRSRCPMRCGSTCS